MRIYICMTNYEKHEDLRKKNEDLKDWNHET